MRPPRARSGAAAKHGGKAAAGARTAEGARRRTAHTKPAHATHGVRSVERGGHARREERLDGGRAGAALNGRCHEAIRPGGGRRRGWRGAEWNTPLTGRSVRRRAAAPPAVAGPTARRLGRNSRAIATKCSVASDRSPSGRKGQVPCRLPAHCANKSAPSVYVLLRTSRMKNSPPT
jgi:hypothetical protein